MYFGEFMIKALKIATLGFIVSVLPIAHAQDKQNTLSQTDLNKMSAQFIELRNKSKSKFEKWHVDMLAFTLNNCAINSKLELDKSIKTHKVSSSGSYSLKDNNLCLNLRDNMTDIKCTKVHARDNPFSAIPKGFYLNQGVFINPKGKIPLPNSKVMIGATCLLSSTNYKSEQLYFGEATMKYTALRPASFNTSIGEQRVLMDSVFFHIDGLKTPIGPTNLIQLR